MFCVAACPTWTNNSNPKTVFLDACYTTHSAHCFNIPFPADCFCFIHSFWLSKTSIYRDSAKCSGSMMVAIRMIINFNPALSAQRSNSQLKWTTKLIRELAAHIVRVFEPDHRASRLTFFSNFCILLLCGVYIESRVQSTRNRFGLFSKSHQNLAGAGHRMHRTQPHQISVVYFRLRSVRVGAIGVLFCCCLKCDRPKRSHELVCSCLAGSIWCNAILDACRLGFMGHGN